MRNSIDKKYFFSLLKIDKTNNLFKTDDLKVFYGYVKKVYDVNRNTNCFNILSNLENYLLIVGDLFMFALLNKEITEEQYNLIKKEIDNILEYIKSHKSDSTTKLNDSSLMLQFYKNSNRDDFLIEAIKI